MDAPTNIVVTPSAATTTITWDSTGPTTEAEYWDGAFWRVLFTVQAAPLYVWDTSKRKGTIAKVRLRAVEGVDVSAWAESAAFTLTGIYSGSLWRAIAMFNNALLWKCNAASGFLQDSSGNARHANITTGLTYSKPSIVYNRPNDTGVNRTTVGSFGSAAQHAGGAWYSSIKTGVLWVKPVSAGWGTDSSALMQIVGRWYVHGATGFGADHVALLVSGFAAVDIGSLAVGASHMLGVACPTGSAQRVLAVVDGAVRYATTENVSATAIDFRAIATGSVNSDYQAVALFTDELDALQLAWLHQVSLNEPNDPPSDPGAFTSPLAAEDHDLSVPIAFGVSVDPQADAIEYYMEYYDPNEAEWILLSDWGSAPSVWDTSAIVQGDGFKLRVKARDIYDEESGWRESGAFEILHDRLPASAPTLEWVWGSQGYVGFYGSAFISAEPGAAPRASRWRLSNLADMSVIRSAWTVLGSSYRLGWNPRLDGVGAALGVNSDFYVDVQYEDQVGVLGARSAAVRGRTAKPHASGPRYIWMRDSSAHERHGTYGIINGTDGASFLNHGVGGDGYQFPGYLLEDAPAGLSGFFGSSSAQARGLWRVNTDDPKIIAPVRVDDLKSTICYTDGGPQVLLYPIAADFGILLRLFLPVAPPAGLRYGIFRFRTGIYEPSPIASTLAFGLSMRDRRLTLDGFRAFSLHASVSSKWGMDTTELGLLPVGEGYTLRLWGKGVVPLYPDGCAAAEDEAGSCHMESNHGLDTVTGVGWGVTGGWVDVGFDARNTPNISAGSNTFPGVVLEFAAWNHPAVVYGSAALPWIADQSDDVTPDEIDASAGLEFHYRLQDPTSPEAPTVALGSV